MKKILHNLVQGGGSELMCAPASLGCSIKFKYSRNRLFLAVLVLLKDVFLAPPPPAVGWYMLGHHFTDSDTLEYPQYAEQQFKCIYNQKRCKTLYFTFLFLTCKFRLSLCPWHQELLPPPLVHVESGVFLNFSVSLK